MEMRVHSKLIKIADEDIERLLQDWERVSGEFETAKQMMEEIQETKRGLEKELASKLQNLDKMVYKYNDLIYKLIPSTTRASYKYKTVVEFLMNKVNKTIKQAAEELKESTKSISETPPRITIKPGNRKTAALSTVLDSALKVLNWAINKLSNLVK